MNEELRELARRGGGVVTREQARQVVPDWVLERACRRGDLHKVLHNVYRMADVPADRPLVHRAVAAWLAGRGALSHTSALAVWGLRVPAPAEPVHVTVPRPVRLRPQPAAAELPGIVVHRREGFRPEAPDALMRRGQLVTPLDRSLVDAWPVLAAADRRAPVIRAVADRLTTPRRLATALAAAPALTGRTELRELLDLLAAGCLSPLEIWGHQHVFTGPGMPRFRRQVRVRIGERSIYLDVLAEAEQVNFELDGASVHGDPRQREIDLRRDAHLATLGILVVRFTHRRLVQETAAVRREILAILAHRRSRGA